MDKIAKLIQTYSDDVNNQSTNSVFSVESLSPLILPNASTGRNKYHKELIIAKVIISELQERCTSQEADISKHKSACQSLEKQLNDALSTIKTLHSDYKTLSAQFTKANQSFTAEPEALSLQIASLQQELVDKEQIYKINLHKLTSELVIKKNDIVSLTNQLSQLQHQLKDNDLLTLKSAKEQLTKDNFALRKQILDMTLSNDREVKECKCDIERLKSLISLGESKSHQLTVELKEKEIELQKQIKLNEQYNTLDQRFTVSMQEKDKNYSHLNEQFTMLLSEHQKAKRDFEEKLALLSSDFNKEVCDGGKLIDEHGGNEEGYLLLKKQKEYIEKLLIAIHPNGELIQQVVELHMEILQLENQKVLLERKVNVNNPNEVNVLAKMRLQIQLFKNELKKHELELSPSLNGH